MPRTSKPKQLRRKTLHTTQCDFTINDFANADKQVPLGGRLKKGAANAVFTEVKSLKNSKQVMDCQPEEEKSWFDKDLDEFDITTSKEYQSEEDEEEKKDEAVANIDEPVQVKLVKSPGRVCCRRKRLARDSEGDVGVFYPDDLWVMLSQCIHPEDIASFSRLCVQAHKITQTVQFWKCLYLRYCNNNKSLPHYLHLSSLERIHGLRQRVIRSLFYTYPTFKERTLTRAPFENQPYHLIGQRCLFSWYEPVKQLWHFNFKFKKERIEEKNKMMQLNGEQENLFNGYKDLYHNLEKDCYVLQVTCQNFVAIPSTMGLVLSQLYLRMSQGMRHYCLRLHFDTNFKQTLGPKNFRRDSQDAVVVLDPITNLRVFPWWQPGYPNNGMYCNNNKSLPHYLHLSSLERIHGLRQRVIRSLFYTYPAFKERTLTRAPFENQPYHLIGQRCLFSWYEPVKQLWHFNFKFKKERIEEKNKMMQLNGEQENLFNGYKDLYHNLEKDCYVLQVTCQNFVAIPSTMGLVLSQLYLRMSQGMRHYCLRLHFDTNFKQTLGPKNFRRDSQDAVVVLDPITNLRVFPWWQPGYPNNGM